ncbi:DNA polymerase III subunit delta' [Sporolactobacillus spathodeae]|uniref:DNA polymerase-3 subunit delta n=1 Tax=Sporolactobacillus spathodeae TaxID=1465502 RepID=A0ABS2QBV8_9BACL|nr:DNA polymerase III subunit delta' [Sporolactobacillus spathodeae]MBM7658805.1 DNA polymerase-3 subunit delta' [Sporolactobacillus spathodeae]
MDWQQLKDQQKTVEKVLRHAALRHELAHAYLFEGPRGTGKRDTALMLAQMLFCEAAEAFRPCGECRNCRRIASGNHPDVVWIRPEENAQTIKKEQVAFLLREFAYHGVESAHKVFILEEAEKLTVQAENSLLKFIEEPNPGTLAILVTSQIHQLLDTIVSRCQVLTFVPLSDKDLAERLVVDGQPRQLASLAAGLTHNYQSAVDLCHEQWFADAHSLVLQLTQRLQSSSEPILPFIYDKFYPLFNDMPRMTTGLDLLLLWYRDLLNLQLNRSENLFYAPVRETLERQMMALTTDQIVQFIEMILEARKQLNAHVNGLSVMERLMAQLGGIRS